MNKHYVLEIDPSAKYEWDQLVLRNPLTHDRADNLDVIASQDLAPGRYLVRVKVEVEVIEQMDLEPKSSVAALPSPSVTAA